MASQEHLDLLKQGVKVWNQWRKEHPEIVPNLNFADLNRVDLWEANLSGVDLSLANLSNAGLRGANLSGANLRGTDLSEASLWEANLSGAELYNVCLSAADLREADLREANLTRADSIRADFSKAHLSKAHLSEANLTEANFKEADLTEADLTEAVLSETGFWGANLTEADLSKAQLRRADLTRADLRRAFLYMALLTEADLRGADLRGADLSGASLGEANLSGTVVGKTNFSNLDLRMIKGLESLVHRGPSSIGIDTIHRSHGQISEHFLRQAGVSEPFVTNMHALIGSLEPIQYYTCFISYSSRDQDFADRLHADLQAAKVRCWFASHDLKMGDRYRDRIEESIRVYDKVLLILSEKAVASTWVEEEVEKAMDKERQLRAQGHKQTVLFPIKLDDTVMQTTKAWAADVRRLWHIGDFIGWHDHACYQRAFTRLLRDLKSEASHPHS